jgi:SAM-dependent methyltransferase
VNGIVFEQVPCGLCGSLKSKPLVKARDPLGISEADFTVVRCGECGLAYQNPRPTLEALKSFYPEGYWWGEKKRGLLAGIEERYRRGLLRKELSLLARNLPRGSRILDVGCGQGDMLLLLKEAGYEACGVENADSAGRFAREKRGLDVHIGDLETSPYGRESFDAVSFFHVLEHLANPLSALTRAQGLLKTAGWLLIQCPNIESAQFKRFGSRWLHLSLPQHFFHFAPGTLGKLLGKAGFRLEAVGHLSLRMNPMSAVLSRHPGLIPCVFPAAGGGKGSTIYQKGLYLLLTYLARPRVRLESWLREGATLTVLARKIN